MMSQEQTVKKKFLTKESLFYFFLIFYPRLSGLDFVEKFFWCQGIFFANFDFEYGCKNKFQDNNGKSCSCFKNKVPLKIDFGAVGTHESHSTPWELIAYHNVKETAQKVIWEKLNSMTHLKRVSMLLKMFTVNYIFDIILKSSLD